VRVLGGSYQRLCQPCIAALPRRPRSFLGAERKRAAYASARALRGDTPGARAKREQYLTAKRSCDGTLDVDTYTHSLEGRSLADIAAETEAEDAREERRRR
jgi:hypothetical protein